MVEDCSEQLSNALYLLHEHGRLVSGSPQEPVCPETNTDLSIPSRKPSGVLFDLSPFHRSVAGWLGFAHAHLDSLHSGEPFGNAPGLTTCPLVNNAP